MIGSDMLYDVYRRMEEIFISKDPFGGRAVMLVGDILQLPPVQARPIFSAPFSKKNRALFNSFDSIWKNFDVVSLRTNHRQGIGRWTECLNNCRVGQPSTEDLALLESRRLRHFPDLVTNEACHVFFTNEEVDNHNLNMLNSKKSELVKITAEGRYPKGYKPRTLKGMVENTPFMKELQLKRGARIILTFNVSIGDSLVNGSLGTVLDFVFEGSKVKAVIIAFDFNGAGQKQIKEHPADSLNYAKQNGCPICKPRSIFTSNSCSILLPISAR